MNEREDSPLSIYIRDWARIIYDATGDQTKVDRAIVLADLNGMFDPVKVAGLSQPVAVAQQPCSCGVMCQDFGTQGGCRYIKPSRVLLRKLVDLTWNHVTESQEVPSTNLADELIDRAAAASPAQSSWQPIDTAPKDGSFLVCAVGDDRGAFVVSGNILATARKANTPSHLGLSYLTHWMPLPAGPSLSSTHQSAPGSNSSHNSGESDLQVTADCTGADTALTSTQRDGAVK